MAEAALSPNDMPPSTCVVVRERERAPRHRPARAVCPSHGSQDHRHRLGRGGQATGGTGRSAHEAHNDGTGRTCPRACVRRCRCRGRGPRACGQQVVQCRSGLHFAHALLRAWQRTRDRLDPPLLCAQPVERCVDLARLDGAEPEHLSKARGRGLRGQRAQGREFRARATTQLAISATARSCTREPRRPSRRGISSLCIIPITAATWPCGSDGCALRTLHGQPRLRPGRGAAPLGPAKSRPNDTARMCYSFI